MEWKPINEAKKDGTEYELYNGWHERAICRWDDEEERWVISAAEDESFDLPLLFMELRRSPQLIPDTLDVYPELKSPPQAKEE